MFYRAYFIIQGFKKTNEVNFAAMRNINIEIYVFF